MYCDVAACLAPVFCVFNDLDAMLAGRQAMHAVFALQFENAHGPFFVHENFDVVAIFAAQNRVIESEIGIGRQDRATERRVYLDQGIGHPDTIAVGKIKVGFGAGTKQEYRQRYREKQGWPTSQHASMMA